MGFKCIGPPPIKSALECSISIHKRNKREIENQFHANGILTACSCLILNPISMKLQGDLQRLIFASAVAASFAVAATSAHYFSFIAASHASMNFCSDPGTKLEASFLIFVVQVAICASWTAIRHSHKATAAVKHL